MGKCIFHRTFTIEFRKKDRGQRDPSKGNIQKLSEGIVQKWISGHVPEGGGTPILDLTGCAAQQGVLLR